MNNHLFSIKTLKGVIWYFLIALICAFVITIPDALWEWKENQNLLLQISMKSSTKSNVQLFYDIGNGINETHSETYQIEGNNQFQKFVFTLPAKEIKLIRLDPLSTSGIVYIDKIQLLDSSNTLLQEIPLNVVKAFQQIHQIVIEKNILQITTDSNINDPIVFIDLAYPLKVNNKFSILELFKNEWKKICIVFVLIFISLLFAHSDPDRIKDLDENIFISDSFPLKMFAKIKDVIKSFIFFIRLIFEHSELIFTLAKREVATQYVGSSLGIIWTFIHPIVLIFVFWVVFSVGFRVKPVNDVSFVVWLTAGMAIWTVFAEIVNGSTGIIVNNSHLIKKTLFQAQLLPVVRIVACMITHSVFLTVLLGLIVFQKMPFSLYYFQFIYYLFAMSVLALGLGWAFSALNVFIRDVGQIVGVIIQVGFWATPIFWDISIMPPQIQVLFKLNPMFYIVQGYRDSFIYFRPIWDRPLLTIYFWSVTILIFIAGALIFKRLKPQFADIL